MSQMNRRRALQLLAALGTTGLTAACATDGDEGPAAPTGKPVKIGLIAPQTGGFKAIGDEIVNGFQLYLTLNGQQLGGHPVTVVTADEGETAKTGKAAVDSLLKQGVLALTGVVNSAVMVGIRDTVEKARVPLVGSNASPKSLQSVVYIWRTSYVLDEPGRAIGPYMAQRLPTGSRVAIIAPDNLGSRDVIQGLQAQFSTAGTGDPRIADPVIWTDTSSTPGGTAYTA
ncbi:ABC transporter substrate-binding protein, partial [Micromonospora sp. DH15]|nr:ABC transporter substrate-binding protein [Micromonospora sp. DH15]